MSIKDTVQGRYEIVMEIGFLQETKKNPMEFTSSTPTTPPFSPATTRWWRRCVGCLEV